MKLITKLAPHFLYSATLFTIIALMGFISLYLAVGPGLPDVEAIRDIRLQTPMRVYARDNQLMAEFGEKRRIPITLDQVPKNFINALLATEDQRFYQHSGVDMWGVARAALNLIATGRKSQGASTITMLVARNYYLTREKHFSRKITEMFLAWKLESELSKDEILELFLNKIPFGHRAYGLGAAAQVYYGKPLNQLSIAQLATLAGIPKGQSKFNPVSYPEHARERRAHVLKRMLDEHFISQAEYQQALAEPVATWLHGPKTTVEAPYFAEMVRSKMLSLFGREAALGDGLRVFTTLDPKLQRYARDAYRAGLREYDQRHGYRGPEQHYQVSQGASHETTGRQQLNNIMADYRPVAGYLPAIVTEVNDEYAKVWLGQDQAGIIPTRYLQWARQYIDENHLGAPIKSPTDVLKVGDLIRIMPTDEFIQLKPASGTDESGNAQTADQQSTNTADATASPLTEHVAADEAMQTSPSVPVYRLAQIPEVTGGFISLNPYDGAIQTLIGGLDFSMQQFNIVTQSRRQPGSNIKPFVYAAAFSKGYTPASIINDAPIIQSDITAGNFWRPKNDADNYRGPTRLREALARSVNTVSIRLVRDITPRYTERFLVGLGFPDEQMKPVPSLALGTASFTPLEVVTGYALMANGGYKVDPWFIERVEDKDGQIIWQKDRLTVCRLCEKILAEREEAKAGPRLASLETTPVEKDLSEESNKTEVASQTDENRTLPAIELDGEAVLGLQPELPVAEEYIAPRVMDERIHFLIDDMMKDVIHRGTAWRTLFNSRSPLLKRHDLAGKTGTTNDAKDAWFSGYNPTIVATAWVGFHDYDRKLGNREFGGKAALPIWQKFMEKALAGKPQTPHPRPEGIVTVKIDPKNGKLATSLTPNPIFEMFRSENVPTEYSEPEASELYQKARQEEDESGSIF